MVHLDHGAPIRFGSPAEDGLGSRGVIRAADGLLAIADVADLPEQGRSSHLLVHDAHEADPSVQFALSRLDDPAMTHVPVGVFRSVSRPCYDDMVRAQVDSATLGAGGPATDEDLARLLAGLRHLAGRLIGRSGRIGAPCG